jgi:hypothetical protein
MHDIMNLIIIIILFGVGVGLINAILPMPGAIKSLLNLFVLIILIIYILQFFGLIKTILPMYRLLH